MEHVKRDERYSNNVYINASTFGTNKKYKLVTINLSHTGFLVASFEYVPFAMNTLLELEIDPNGDILSHPINCIGKVVRMVKGESAGLKEYIESFAEHEELKSIFGVQISEISQDDRVEWKNAVTELQK